MNDASARGLIPVPFADDGFAQYELDRCRADQNSFDQALTIISIAAAATVFFQRIRNKEHRKFPDNIFTMMLVALCGIHLALLISIASQNRVVTEKVQPWMALCELQGRMFHWCSCAAIWNVFCVILTLHRVIVLKIPVAELARHSRIYYASLVGLPSLAVTVCSIFADYGPYPGLHNCWIEPGPGRLLYFHSFTLVTFSACIALGPPTIYALWKAYHTASQPQSVGLFRSLMWRQILLATYGLAVVGTFLMGGINNMLLESHKKSSYIKSTAYPVCIFSAINFASLGLLVSLIYWSTRHQSLKLKQTFGKAAKVVCCGRLHHFQTHEFDHDADLENERGGNAHDDKDEAKKSKFSTRHAPVVLSARNVSPRSPSLAREPLRSAFDSDGRSVTSVPPDPQHRAAHQVATNAYTSTLLEYVREQLLDELEAEDDSDFSSVYDDESDTRSSLASNTRSSLASNASVIERFSRGSYPTTPQANFHHDVSPRQERISDLRDLVVNRRATITEL